MTEEERKELLREVLTAVITKKVEELSITKEDILESIREGVCTAMPYSVDINEAISKGMSDSMPYASELLGVFGQAVENGVKENPNLKKRK